MAANEAVADPAIETRGDWPALARRAWRRRVSAQAAVLAFLVVVSVPIILPYFWMVVIAFTARTGGISSDVLWTACAVIVPAVILYSIVHMATSSGRLRLGAGVAVAVVAGALLAALVGSRLHLDNFRFLTHSDFVEELRSKATSGAQFPSVWTAFLNSLALALSQTAIILTVASLAGSDWLRFLDRTGHTDAFTHGRGQLLAELAYDPRVAHGLDGPATRELFEVVGRWIGGHDVAVAA